MVAVKTGRRGCRISGKRGWMDGDMGAKVCFFEFYPLDVAVQPLRFCCSGNSQLPSAFQSERLKVLIVLDVFNRL